MHYRTKGGTNMTLLGVDSFEHTSTNGVMAKYGAGGTNFGAPSTSFGRNGGKGLSLQSLSQIWYTIQNISDEHATLIVGFALRFVGLPASENAMLSLYSDARTTQHISLTVDTAGLIRVRRGGVSGTLLATAAAATFAVNIWHYIEMKCTLSDTVGVVEVRVDGNSTPIINISSQDTKNGGTKTVFDSLTFFAGNGNPNMDDMYFCNGAGSVNNNFLGDCIVECLFPTSDGATSGLTPSTGVSHFATVDESPENTTDYNSSSVLNTTDTYGMSNLATASGTVYGVQVVQYAQKDIAGVRNLASVVRASGTDYAGADQAVGIGFGFFRQIWETDPSDSAAWTIADVNAAEVGVKVR